MVPVISISGEVAELVVGQAQEFWDSGNDWDTGFWDIEQILETLIAAGSITLDQTTPKIGVDPKDITISVDS